MNNTCTTANGLWPHSNPTEKGADIGMLTLESFLDHYLTLHNQSFISGPSYDDFVIPMRKYLLSELGNIPVKSLTPQLLRKCYENIFKWPMVPLCIITGINHLLEVALDYAISQGAPISNAAGLLSSSHIQKTQRKLPYTHFPLIVTQPSPAQLDVYPENGIRYDVTAPFFSDIYYLGTDLDDGISLVRRFLIDELEVNPWPYADLTLSKWPLQVNQRVVWVAINT